MSVSDPIADFLTRIRNGIMGRKARIDCPRSLLKVRIAEILREEGFVDAVSTDENGPQGTLSVVLRYDNTNHAAITGLRRVSRPGQRAYANAKGLKKVRNGLGISIVSTSQGVMTDRKARELGVGGEVLCEVW
jgi:small subunit ribosomal protein S8